MEQQYLDLLKNVLENGEDRSDRTGVGTRSLFGKQIKFDLSLGFPAITTKKLFMKPLVAELLWFLEGSSDERRLAEIQHGTRDQFIETEEMIEGELVKTRKRLTTIWSGNAYADYWVPKARYPGDAGDIYGVQWRKWKKTALKTSKDHLSHLSHINGGTTHFDAKVLVEEIDQVKKIIDTIKTNPGDRRMVLTAFNVGELENMSLPPCHMFAQFYVGNLNNGKPKKLNCQVYIRSNDLFLGLPFNIASYALLVHMIAQITGIAVGDLIITIGDAHIYSNHIEQVKLQLARTPHKMPSLRLNPNINNIDDFKMEDISLENYEHHPAITAPMAV